MSLSAMDRAKNLVERFNGMTFSGGIGTEWLISQIAEQIEQARRDALLEAAEIAEVHISNRSGGVWGNGYSHAVMEITKNIRSRAEGK